MEPIKEKTMNPLISIIIVNYHSANFTEKCIASIYQCAGNVPVEIIVIDNASFDGCGEILQKSFPTARFIQSSDNLGFAGANNLGIRAASGTHFLFLNPDTEVRQGAIDKLFAAVSTISDGGMAGARLLNADLSVQTTSITAFPSILNQMFGAEYLRKKFPSAKLWGIGPLFESLDHPVSVDAISGACMMAPRAVIERVAGFTSQYFMYAEDVDLCLKVEKAGWRVYYVPDAVVVHYGGQSSGERQEQNYAEIMIRESTTRFMQAHRGWWYASLFRISTAVAAVCRIAAMLVLSPIAAITGRNIARPLKKWLRILSWALGFQTWTRHERTTPEPAGSC